MSRTGSPRAPKRSAGRGIPATVQIEALGDAAWVIRGFDGPAYVLAERLRQTALTGVVDVAASYESVGVYCEPGALDEGAVRAWISAYDVDGPPEAAFSPRVHEIPVCYEMGEDLDEVCERLNLGARQLVDLHTSSEYECFAVGFCPGFGYLGWLPERLAGVPRRATPRTRVEAGSVGITGRQTAAYPMARPGGWALIGRTPLTLVDVEDGYFPIRAGDRIRFRSIGATEFEALQGGRL